MNTRTVTVLIKTSTFYSFPKYNLGLVAEVYQLREQEILLKEQLRVAAEKLAAEESFRAQEREHFSDVDRGTST